MENPLEKLNKINRITSDIRKLLFESLEDMEECWVCGTKTKDKQIMLICEMEMEKNGIKYKTRKEWYEHCHDSCFEWLLTGKVPYWYFDFEETEINKKVI